MDKNKKCCGTCVYDGQATRMIGGVLETDYCCHNSESEKFNNFQTGVDANDVCDKYERIEYEWQERDFNEKMRNRKCCDNCYWYRYNEIGKEFICTNAHSKYCAESRDERDTCKEWERA